MSRVKTFFFGLIAVLVIPALFFLALEQGLKLFGYDKNFDYFAEIQVNGQSYYQDNPVFIEQFYPASLDITPLENTFSVQPDDSTVRVFVLGGSAARGFPNPAHGFSRHLEAMLKQALPSRPIEVINTAMTAINSHVVYETARSIPKGSADFAIVLMGNNEVIGPYGPGTFNQKFLSSLKMIRSLQAIKRSSIGQAMTDLAAGTGERDHKQELKWKGMQMFTSESVALNDPRLETVYSHYRRNLIDIVATLQDKGAHVIVSTVPVNLRHSAPFLSAQKTDMPAEKITQWESALSLANDSMLERNWPAAISRLNTAASIDPNYAETQFQLAIAYEAMEDYGQSAIHLQKARDLDSLRFRADSRINSIVRDVASEFDQSPLTLVDNDAAFATQSRPGQPGWNLFLEHVHYDFSGDYVLAREFSRAILKDMGVNGYRLPGQAVVASRIGYPSNMTLKVMDRVVNMVKAPPFTGQSNQAALMQFIDDRKRQSEAQLGSIADQIERRQAVLRSGRGDWRLRYELAHLLEHVGDQQGASEQLKLLYIEYPHHRDSQIMLAKMLHKDGQYQEELTYLEAALGNARGDDALIAQLSGWLGLVYFKLGDAESATNYLEGVTEDYQEQIHYVLQAYATLIRYSDQSGSASDVKRYAAQAQRYGKGLVGSGRVQEYPTLYAKMSQIMRLAGDQSQAKTWKDMQPRRARKQPPENG